MERLRDFFSEHKKIALAFSGGTDSAFLLYAAKYFNADVKAYYVKSQFQPQFELDDAIKLSKELNADLSIINVDILSYDEVKANPKNRCYYCKKHIFSKIID